MEEEEPAVNKTSSAMEVTGLQRIEKLQQNRMQQCKQSILSTTDH